MNPRGRSLLLSVLLHAAGAGALSLGLPAPRPKEPSPGRPAPSIALSLSAPPPAVPDVPAFEPLEAAAPAPVLGPGELPVFQPDRAPSEPMPEPPPLPTRPPPPEPPRPRMPPLRRIPRSEASQAPLPAPSPAPVVPTPVPGQNPPPDYPRVARLRGWQGTVLVGAEIGPEGLPLRVWVESSSGHPPLDEAAREACEGWRFAPAPVRGTAFTSVRFEFLLRS